MSPRVIRSGAGRTRRRRPGWMVALSVLLLVMPMLEVAVIISVGRQIGIGWTLLMLVFWSSLGAWLVTREGSRTWRLLKNSLATGHELSRQLTDAALVLVGGTLLLAPGFVTDAMGLFLVVPFTRPITRRVLQRVVEKKLLGGLISGDPFGEEPMGFGAWGSGPSGPSGFDTPTDDARTRPPHPGTSASGSSTAGEDEVLEGEIVDPPRWSR